MAGNGDPSGASARAVQRSIPNKFVRVTVGTSASSKDLAALDGVDEADVAFVFAPPWTVDRITDKGRRELEGHGITVPEQGSRLPVPGHDGTVPLTASAVPCPYCGATRTRLDSPFGPTRCRMIWYCEACRQQFEHMKKV